MDITFIDLFSGIGGFHSGLEKAGMRCIGWCEFDKFAQKSYRAMYDTEGLWFSDDIRTTKGYELPRADIWTFGFPCQDVSIAGKQRGIKRGTRSGLFFEVMRLLDEKENDKPKWLIVENVKNLLSIDRGHGFYTVLCEMAERGYTCEWKVYNSKDYGVPQNRERVYLVGYLGETGRRELLPITRKNHTVIKQVIGGSQGMRVYDPSGVSCTLSALGGGIGAKTGLYQFSNVSIQACLTPDILKKRQNGRRLKEVGEPAFTLTGRDRHGLLIKTANNQGYAMAYHGDGVDLAYPNSETRRGRVQPQQSNALTTSDNLGVVLDDGAKVYIRKLTPRECWRLQGFTDEQFDKAQSVNSNTQLYKQAGNAVTVNVTYEIGKHIMGIFEGQLNGDFKSE